MDINTISLRIIHIQDSATLRGPGHYWTADEGEAETCVWAGPFDTTELAKDDAVKAIQAGYAAAVRQFLNLES